MTDEPHRMLQNHKPFESKWIGGSILLNKAELWLQSNFVPHPNFPASKIHTLYYESLDRRSLYEKADGDFIKTKYRLRWYDSNEYKSDNYVFLEIKRKIGAKREKKRIKTQFKPDSLSKEHISSTVFKSIFNEYYKHKIPVPSNLIPTLKISYIRKRFIDLLSDAEICLDYDIISEYANHKIGKSSSRPVLLNNFVIEVKHCKQDKLPFLLDNLVILGLKKTSFSKYKKSFQLML